jgi:cellulose 1,4-beta-cellobiosidase
VPRSPIAAAVAAISAWVVFSLTTPTAAHAGATCKATGVINVSTPRYRVQNNEWTTTTRQCIATAQGTRWLLTTGAPLPGTGWTVGYPSIYAGCIRNWCTAASNMPVQVSKISRAVTSWSVRWSAEGRYNAAYDLWFQTTTNGLAAPDGAELMIWLNAHGGVHLGGPTLGVVTIGGVQYRIWLSWKNTWYRIAYERLTPVTSVQNLDVAPIIRDAIAHGAIQPTWYLLNAQAGFEIWSGGNGLMTNAFSFILTPTA